MNLMAKVSLALALMGSLNSYLGASVEFPSGQNCVAWKARKTMFLFSKSEPVGTNCNITVKVDVPAPSHFQVTVVVPLAEFKSGELERDQEIRKLLKEEVQPDLIFLSDTITARDWPSYLDGSIAAMKGVLKIGGRAYPVILQLQKRGDGQPLVGKVDVSLKALEIEAPGFAGGLVAKVDDTIELSFQVTPRPDKNWNP